jgi:chromosome segregation ATPase
MDPELKSYLEAIQQQLVSLQSDVSSLRSDVGALKLQSENLQTQIDETKRDIREHTEAVETRLLQAFWKWAKTADARARQNAAVVGGLDLRVQAIEDRLTDLESRLAS